jgi:carboxyl-terminal processing protease
VDWRAAAETFRPRAVAATSRDQFADVVNEMLGLLQTSHTRYFTPEEPGYYELLGVFESSGAYAEPLSAIRRSLGREELGYVGIGVATIRTPEGTFVASVYDGGPAHRAGILVGDRLLAVDQQPFHPIDSFASGEGREAVLCVQRQRDASPMDVVVQPTFLPAATALLDATRHSARIVTVDRWRIGYVHMWSYAGQAYQDALVDALFGGPLDGADALLLDLRDGLGGASTEYLNLFQQNLPRMVMKPRDAAPMSIDQQWRRPVALLINGRVRSGKEVFALGFQRMGRGPVIGERTAGAVVAGALRFFPDHSVLYLAVADVEVDGQRWEGVGVPATIEVEREIPFCAGLDPQYQEGERALVRILEQEGK